MEKKKRKEKEKEKKLKEKRKSMINKDVIKSGSQVLKKGLDRKKE